METVSYEESVKLSRAAKLENTYMIIDLFFNRIFGDEGHNLTSLPLNSLTSAQTNTAAVLKTATVLRPRWFMPSRKRAARTILFHFVIQ